MRKSSTAIARYTLLLALLPFAAIPTALGQLTPAVIHPEDVLPDISGQSLSGKPLQLSDVIAGKSAIVVFSFSKAAGKDARSWNERLSVDYCSHHFLACSTVIMLASAPGFLRGMIVSELNRMTPPSIRAGTIVCYQNEDAWRQRLAVVDDSHAYVFLLDAAGHIQWRNSESFSEAEYVKLKNSVSESFQSVKPR